MTYADAGLILIALLIWGIYQTACWLDSKLPTAEQEEQRAKRDMEEVLKRANKETQERKRVRTGATY